MNKQLSGLLAGIALSLTVQGQTPATLTVNLGQQGHRIQPSMYGIFFEEINHSGDGGLYGELIQNRGFEDKNIPSGTRLDSGFAKAPSAPNYRGNQVRNFRLPWNMDNQWPGWSVKNQEDVQVSLVTDHPLHQATPHSLQLVISKASAAAPIQLSNEGYWGISVKKGEKYNLRFYLRADNKYIGNVTAGLAGTDGKTLAQSVITLKKTGDWTEYKATLTAADTDPKAHFVLSFNHSGTVWVDYVSLFPEKTFKNRKNGMRADVAQTLADLKPAFMRWPGGCIVEGLTLENRVKWKETLGDPMTRPGEYDLWGYRNSYGFGYHEYLQFIEDIGAKGMFVANMGLSCSVRNGDYCKPEEVGSYLQDALDAIEYAIGDTKTTWGAKRAAAGHPAPFPLKYIEVGNENAGVEIYNERYNIFHKAISAKYPQIKIISNHGLGDNVQSVQDLDMIDPHYYVSPDWFYARANNLFDSVKRQPGREAYVGEYAVNRNVGTGNMNGALSEAAFLIGAERNADYVTMTSYAPLIENSNKRDWQVNLIWVKSDQVMGRSSYYVQKMFAENRPDINLQTQLREPAENLPAAPFSGRFGLTTNRTRVQVSNLQFTGEGGNALSGWQTTSGTWTTEGSNYTSDTAGRAMGFFASKAGNGTLTFNLTRARRNGPGFPGGGGGGRFGGTGFSLLFGATDDKNYYQLTLSNFGVNLEKVVNGTAQYAAEPVRMPLEDERAYAIKTVTTGDRIEVFIDNQRVLNYKYESDSKRYAIAGIDEKTNEVVIKVVNAASAPFKTHIDLAGASVVPDGKIITLSSAALTDENTFEQPQKIAPVTSDYKGFSGAFDMEFKPHSLTILRIKKAVNGSK